MILPSISSGLRRRDSGFRWRSGDNVTRLEGFSDGVFGFAVTLLVLSIEVPRSSVDLIRLVQGLPAFAAAFAVLVLIWHSHCLFFRRYGLQDGITTLLNALLLFVVIFYVYPLRFLFTLLSYHALGLNPGAVKVAPEHAVSLLVIYALGSIAVFLLMVLLYTHAWRLRDALALSPRERYVTVTSIQYHAIYCGVGLLVVVWAVIGGPRQVPWAAFCFALLGPLCGFHGWWRGRSLPNLEMNETETPRAAKPGEATTK